ncbi:hypothetical protein [Romboutsia timonensis]|uniref:hypothetical protein n=1 Tax=Romboutsia timonensis TaxID=1776391 RepID=UPI002A7F7E28|nr:hypothetical protein [Romboutsia timonensis]MDY3960974.1 hypothetical protein [Romboutsia timonensis]
MLERMLKKAYDDLNNRIVDFNRYIDLDNIVIAYKDFGTQIDDVSFIGGRINVDTEQIYINEYIYEFKFKLANSSKLKYFRKEAHKLYYDCVSTIKHELIHLYLYKKYEYLEDTEPYGTSIHSDVSPLFMIYCELCEAGLSIESKEADLYGFAMLFSKFYKENFDYKEDLYELHSFIRKEFKKAYILEYFNAYAVFEKLNLKYKSQDKVFLKNKQDIEAFEDIKKIVRNKLSSWDIEISKQFKICS